jgi:hypothetical protein
MIIVVRGSKWIIAFCNWRFLFMFHLIYSFFIPPLYLILSTYRWYLPVKTQIWSPSKLHKLQLVQDWVCNLIGQFHYLPSLRACTLALNATRLAAAPGAFPVTSLLIKPWWVMHSYTFLAHTHSNCLRADNTWFCIDSELLFSTTLHI